MRALGSGAAGSGVVGGWGAGRQAQAKAQAAANIRTRIDRI
jgi:hypothetical protein